MGKVNVSEILEDDASDDLRTALESREKVAFKTSDEDIVDLYPEHFSMRQAEVDLANQNVRIKYNTHDPRESYICVVSRQDFSLVVSDAVVDNGQEEEVSREFYLVKDGQTFLYNGEEYEQYWNPGPRKAAEETPKLYEKAKRRAEQSN